MGKPTEIIQKLQKTALEEQARRESESLVIFKPSGTKDHTLTEALQQSFAKNRDGSINWVETWALRQNLISAHSKVERDNFNSKDKRNARS